MVPQRPLPMGGGGAGEIERPHLRVAEGRAHHLHHIGVDPLFGPCDLRADRADVYGGIGQGLKGGAHGGGLHGRQIALHVDHDIVKPLGIGKAKGLEDAV